MWYKKKKPLFDKGLPKKTNSETKLDKEFSLFIRLRDAIPGGLFRCISCGQIKPFAKADCGHFYSRRHKSVRFDEDDSHAECSYCNRFDSEHLINYQTNLIRKIGMQRFQLLKVKAGQTKKYSEFELQYLIKHYQTENKRLKQEKGL